MPIDYKKELETAAKNMILTHDPDILIKMIVRMIIQKVKVRHVGILLHQEEKDTYILAVSRGPSGIKVPAGFARMDTDNPLIRFFKEHSGKAIFNDDSLVYDEVKEFLDKDGIATESRQRLHETIQQMDIFEVVVCIPSYFKDDLLGILLLGRKVTSEDFGRDELNFFNALASDVAMAIRNARLFKQLQDELSRRKQLFINTIIALASAIEAKDCYTHGHTERVTNLSLTIGRRLFKENFKELNDKFLDDLRLAALLHDIGKIGVPETILNKEGPLTQEEWEKMKLHPIVGAKILQPIEELERSIAGIKYHHERFDGNGYPENLKDGQIPLIAGIIAVADSFDAMTSDRPYRSAKSKGSAISEIQSLSGKQFDPSVVSVFLQLFKEDKI